VAWCRANLFIGGDGMAWQLQRAVSWNIFRSIAAYSGFGISGAAAQPEQHILGVTSMLML